MTTRLLGVLTVVLVALPLGWLSGASGRKQLNRALQAVELEHGLREARRSVVSARLDLESANFRTATAHLEDARCLLYHSRGQLDERGRGLEENAQYSDWALAQVDNALRLVHQLEQESLGRDPAHIRTQPRYSRPTDEPILLGGTRSCDNLR
jgi:hypothetical protein